MASPTTSLPRARLAELNQLRYAPAWLQLSSHLLVILTTGVLWRWEAIPWPMRFAALVVNGAVLATCFAPLHECCHRTAFRSKRTNDVVAWWMGVLSFYNATFYRRYHQWHHRYTHQPGLDPELDDPVPTDRLSYVLEISGFNWWTGKVQGYLRLLFGDLSHLPYLSAEIIPQVRRSVRMQFSLYGLVLVLSLIDGNGFVLWSWLLPLAIGQPFLRVFVLAEHSGCSFSDDGLANTRTTLTSAPVRWLMWNMPFNAEHHLYPSLPFHALAAAHLELAPQLQHLDHGYLAVHRQLLQQLSSLSPVA